MKKKAASKKKAVTRKTSKEAASKKKAVTKKTSKKAASKKAVTKKTPRTRGAQAAVQVVRVGEEWGREGEESDLQGVMASRSAGDEWPWTVGISVAEFVREEPLESELVDGISRALQGVSGVTAVAHVDREGWAVQGTPDGEELVRACAAVVDRLAERARPYVEG